MSNVTVTAVEGPLEVEVFLGYTSRGAKQVAEGDSVDVVVAGGQSFTVREGKSDEVEADVVAEGADVTDDNPDQNPVANEVVEDGDQDCGDGTGRTVNQKAVDDEVAANIPDPDADALGLGSNLFASED